MDADRVTVVSGPRRRRRRRGIVALHGAVLAAIVVSSGAVAGQGGGGQGDGGSATTAPAIQRGDGGMGWHRAGHHCHHGDAARSSPADPSAY